MFNMIWWRKRGRVGSNAMRWMARPSCSGIFHRGDGITGTNLENQQVKKPLEKPLEKPVQWISEVNKWTAWLSLILHFFTSSLLAALWRFVLKASLTRLTRLPQPQLSHPVSLGSRRKACWTCWMAKVFMRNMYTLPCFAVSHQFVAFGTSGCGHRHIILPLNVSRGHQSFPK